MTDFFGTVLGNLVIGAGQNHAENIAVVAARNILVPDVARQALAHFPKHLLHRMAAPLFLQLGNFVGV